MTQTIPANTNNHSFKWYGGEDNVATLTGDGILTVSQRVTTPAITLGANDLQTTLNDKAPIASPTFTGTVGGITKSMVGLGNVDNTSDAQKPISSATQTELDKKAPLASPTFTGTVTGINKEMVALGYLDNTAAAWTSGLSGDAKHFITTGATP